MMDGMTITPENALRCAPEDLTNGELTFQQMMAGAFRQQYIMGLVLEEISDIISFQWVIISWITMNEWMLLQS